MEELNIDLSLEKNEYKLTPLYHIIYQELIPKKNNIENRLDIYNSISIIKIVDINIVDEDGLYLYFKSNPKYIEIIKKWISEDTYYIPYIPLLINDDNYELTDVICGDNLNHNKIYKYYIISILK